MQEGLLSPEGSRGGPRQQAEDRLDGIVEKRLSPDDRMVRLGKAATNAIEVLSPADSSAATGPAIQVITIDMPYIADDRLRAAVLRKKREGLDTFMGIERKIQAHQADEAAPALIVRTLNSSYHQGEMEGMSEQARRTYLNNHVMGDATSVAFRLFDSRVIPDESAWQEIDSLYTVEDAQRIRGGFMKSLSYWLEYKAVPPINESDLANIPGYKINQGQHLFLQDYEWLNTWRESLKNNPQPNVNIGNEDHWQYRMNEIRRQVADFKAAHPEPTPPARDETAAQPAEEPESAPIPAATETDPVKKARDTLESELRAINEFFEGKRPEIGYLEDWQLEQMRKQGEWAREDYLSDYVNPWLKNHIAPLIFQARLRGDDPLAKDFVNLCSPDQFDTLILTVGELIKEATAKG